MLDGNADFRPSLTNILQSDWLCGVVCSTVSAEGRGAASMYLGGLQAQPIVNSVLTLQDEELLRQIQRQQRLWIGQHLEQQQLLASPTWQQPPYPHGQGLQEPAYLVQENATASFIATTTSSHGTLYGTVPSPSTYSALNALGSGIDQNGLSGESIAFELSMEPSDFDCDKDDKTLFSSMNSLERKASESRKRAAGCSGGGVGGVQAHKGEFMDCTSLCTPAQLIEACLG